jgi:hypothetical protein
MYGALIIDLYHECFVYTCILFGGIISGRRFNLYMFIIWYAGGLGLVGSLSLIAFTLKEARIANLSKVLDPRALFIALWVLSPPQP